MARYRHGLVVGKFAPLHLGHELVIRRALDACESVTILSWSSPELPGADPARRAAWLQRRFPETRRLVLDREMVVRWRDAGLAVPELPENTAPDADHHRFVAAVLHAVVGQMVDAVFTSEAYGDAFAADLTTHFRAQDPDHPNVVHIALDPARRLVGASGTLVRSDVHAHRHLLAPEIYASFVERICLLGGESTGKSTLSAALAERYRTRFAAEYGRELWERKSGRLEFADMLAIATAQVAREEREAAASNRYLFCDTSPLTTLFYSENYFGRVDPALEHLAERRYDRVYLCAPDFAHVQDGTREGEAFRRLQHDWYLAQLDRRRIPYRLLSGTLEQRIAAAEEDLELAPAPRSQRRSAG